MPDDLAAYRSKRDFQSTPEPPVERQAKRTRRKRRPRFVVQEHDARNLHWDLRLEHDGTLASWALPRGVPDDPRRNRLAVRTEDHPLEYLEFAGEIPAGEYGAGTMRIWDHGEYEPEKWREDEVIAVFHGERMRGRYALFRTRGERDWMIHRMDPPLDADRDPMPETIAPMLATLGSLPRDEEGWAYEIKWDGVRALARCEDGRLRLFSRNLRDITASYPELRPLARALGSRPAILDGEIVALDGDDRPSFARLQERMHVQSEAAARRRAQANPVVLMLFDLLYLDGQLLLELPYAQRRARLEQLALAGTAWQTPANHLGGGAALLKASAGQGLEGLVAKRLDSPYEPGRRSRAWLKIKNKNNQEFVVGGWVPGAGRRSQHIGALLLGHKDTGGRLVYAGRVGTGFTDAMLAELAARLEPLRRRDSPFADDGRAKLPGDAVFVEPALVAEVEFTEWTPDGMLRHPSFRGLRQDKDANEVAREVVFEDAGAPLLDSVREVKGAREVTLSGRTLRLTNYDKVLYPATGFTKGDLVEYYARIASAIVPHLCDRPLTLKRYPNGVEADFFYEKNCPSHRPEWVQTASIAGGRGGASIDYCLVQDAPTLVWAANLASIELHVSLSRAQHMERPTTMVFDLDPGAPAELLQCCEVGLILRALFDGLGLRCFAKTSGAKGLQVYVPLNVEAATYTMTKGFARQVAEMLEGQARDLVVSRMTRSARSGRVFVDWSQNDRHKTTVSVYSVRALQRPTVSTPVGWEEVQAALDAGSADGLRFETARVLERVARDGDLFAPVLSLAQELP